MKKAITYLRFSSNGQSSHSIDRQDIVTNTWMEFTNTVCIDKFIDEGYSARTFDRPDVKKLFDFIAKHHKNIDYLVVAELTRFSRDAGSAIKMVTEIQTKYNIKIVSAAKATVYDVFDSNLFLLMGLEFLMGNSENIKRQNDINGGIYTAKVEGRYIGTHAPFGYKKAQDGKHKVLVIDEASANIVRYIFKEFIAGTPVIEIRRYVKAHMGFTLVNEGYIHKMLRNEIYIGFQQVKPWGNKLGGMFKANHEPIIDMATWQSAQDKINGKQLPKISVNENFPLRSVLKCWCGAYLTGAPSKGKYKYYDYYKCNHGKHNNISTTKAHTQLAQAFNYMSLPSKIVSAIEDESEKLLSENLKTKKAELNKLRAELESIQNKIDSVADKWICNQIDMEDYQRAKDRLIPLRAAITQKISILSKDENEMYFVLKEKLKSFTDLNGVYSGLTLSGKQQMIRSVFDNGLYYENGTYRTHYIMPIFTHNLLILKEKQLLEIDKKGDFIAKISCGGAEESRTPVQT